MTIERVVAQVGKQVVTAKEPLDVIVTPELDEEKLDLILLEVAKLAAMLMQGFEVPQYMYRTSYEAVDHIYKEYGWIHLHIAPEIDNDILLMVEDRPDVGKIVFLCICDHEVFREEPRGKSIAHLRIPSYKAVGRMPPARVVKAPATVIVEHVKRRPPFKKP